MSSIWAGLSGIRSHQTWLDVIGNNLSNVETVGFKASRVSFAEMMSQTVRDARAGSAEVGGTNPAQIGLGVEVGSITRDFTQGGLRDTGNPLDLAVDGKGFLVLNNGASNVFCRSATFTVDAQNYLVDSATGYRLTDTSGEDINIPYNERIPAKKTENVNYVGNLSSSAVVPVAEILKTTEAFTEGGVAAAAATELNDLDSTSTAYVDGDIIRISGKTSDGASITPVDFVYGASNDGVTVGDLLDAITGAYGGAATASIDADGNILLSAAAEGDASFMLTLENLSGTGVTDWSANAFYTDTDGVDGGTRSSSVMIYDSQGEGHVLTLTFQRVGALEWNMTATFNDADGALTKDSISGIRFATDGSFDAVNELGSNAQALVIDFGGKAESQTVLFNFGTQGDFDGLTQFGGSSTAVAAEQDGYSSGVLSSISIGRDGKIDGIYTNGKKQQLAEIQMATFDNPEGLESLGKNMWGRTVNSGEPWCGAAQSGRAGGIVNSSVEGSNVEAATELTKLIIAQYGYQLSARTMSVSKSIIQEIANIVR